MDGERGMKDGFWGLWGWRLTEVLVSWASWLGVLDVLMCEKIAGVK